MTSPITAQKPCGFVYHRGNPPLHITQTHNCSIAETQDLSVLVMVGHTWTVIQDWGVYMYIEEGGVGLVVDIWYPSWFHQKQTGGMQTLHINNYLSDIYGIVQVHNMLSYETSVRTISHFWWVRYQRTQQQVLTSVTVFTYTNSLCHNALLTLKCCCSTFHPSYP